MAAREPGKCSLKRLPGGERSTFSQHCGLCLVILITSTLLLNHQSCINDTSFILPFGESYCIYSPEVNLFISVTAAS